MDFFRMTVSRNSYVTPDKDAKFKAGMEIQNEFRTDPQVLKLTVPALADMIAHGHCVRSCILEPMNENNTKTDKNGKTHHDTEKAFVEQSAIFLDFDNKTDPPMQEFLTADGVRDYVNKTIGANVVSLVSESSTSSEALRKWHVIMVLDKPQTNLQEVKNAIRNLVNVTFKGTADKACSDPARLAFGSTPDKMTKIYDGVLPFELIKAPEKAVPVKKSKKPPVLKVRDQENSERTTRYSQPLAYTRDNDFSTIDVPKDIKNKAYSMAKEVYLPDLAAALGLDFRRNGAEFRCVQQNSLTIYYKHGAYKFKNFGEDCPTPRGCIPKNTSGDALKFTEMAGNMTHIEALNFITDNYIINSLGLKTSQPAYKQTDFPLPPPEEKKEFTLPIENPVTQNAVKGLQNLYLHPGNNPDMVNKPRYDHDIVKSRAFEYLTQQRSISPKIIYYLMMHGFITMEQNTNNVVFNIFDKFEDLNNLRINGTENFTREIKAIEKIGTGLKKFKSKSVKESGYGFELCRSSNPDKLMLFESAVDMLSFMQMYTGDGYKNFRFVSMNGCTPNLALETMKRYNIPPQKVYIATDNDGRGNGFAKDFMEENNIPPSNRRKPAIGKDWNDQLQVQSGKITLAQLEENYKKKEAEKENKKVFNNRFDGR